MTRLHAFSADDALTDLDATGLVEALRAGAVSVPEVVEAAIARTEQVDAELGAVAYAAYDRAREEARAPRAAGSQGCRPSSRTTSTSPGCPPSTAPTRSRPCPRGRRRLRPDVPRHRTDPARQDAALRVRLLAAAEHVRLGPVRSPWNRDHYAGASSAGSSALVAAGAVPIAHANDGGGSIRIPASVNGLVGLKPTRDRLAQDTDDARHARPDRLRRRA